MSRWSSIYTTKRSETRDHPTPSPRWDTSATFHPTTLELLQKSTSLWLRRLSTPVHSDITNFASYNDDDLAKRADSLLDAHAASNPRSPTAASTVPPDEDDRTDDSPYDTVASSAQHFNAFKRHINGPVAQTPHPRSQKNASSTPSSFRKSSSTSRSCYYHERFGPTAKKCQQPCVWSKNVLWGHRLQRWPPYPLMLSFCMTPIQVFSSSSTPAPADPRSKVHSGCITSTDTNLIAANGSSFLIYGYKTLQLSFAGSNYKWDFIVADVSTPIIGADFLANFNLFVYVANRRLFNTSTLASTSIAAAPADLALQISTPRKPTAPSSHPIPRFSAQYFTLLLGRLQSTAYSTTSRPPARPYSQSSVV